MISVDAVVLAKALQEICSDMAAWYRQQMPAAPPEPWEGASFDQLDEVMRAGRIRQARLLLKKYLVVPDHRPRWTCDVPNEGVVRDVPGATKSEARAELKRLLKLEKLPPGVTIEKQPKA